ncbi:TPA: family 1 glycosylhydrolase, partial [Enterococcus faecium]|nr:family 1 glycosylhydrolase [Enterococcus faecium]
PGYMLTYFARKGYDLDITSEDLAELKKGTVDYIGFSYYMSFAITHKEDNVYFDYHEQEDFVRNEYLNVTAWGWQIDPEGLRYSLNWFTDHYRVP